VCGSAATATSAWGLGRQTAGDDDRRVEAAEGGDRRVGQRPRRPARGAGEGGDRVPGRRGRGAMRRVG
jgi:hypothetical protein